ncbi:FKS1_dom1 domain-containing protein, partial [Haematococcus lacustris]
MDIEGAVMEAMLSMALHGDGSWVLERVTTPLFLLLAHEMDVLSQEDVAYRLGYDDVNESLCSQPIVYGLLRRLGLSRKAILLGE